MTKNNKPGYKSEIGKHTFKAEKGTAGGKTYLRNDGVTELG
jgi:hypothetical protein